ncbi:MAG: GntR family transcriptional regulator [Erysipelotrichaceae bacterium]|nr:GntR family transcriptional regulator [Erysipelotrichaceae bacterium]MDY5251612.1 GntR family transcriptional regulator [Erysipelotrichaceae bacterium]
MKKKIIKDYILNQIESGIYAQGQIIESENELCNKFSCSRMTVRNVLDELVSKGTLYRRKGIGTFVSARPKYSEFQCGVGFSKEAKRRGLKPSTSFASLKLISPTEYIAEKLNISANDKVWEVRRVRCFDNVPVVYICEYFIYKQCPDLNEKIIYNSIYDHLEKKGIKFAFMDQKLEAVACPKSIANLLTIEDNSPVILMTLTAHMQNGFPYNFGFEYYNTNIYKLVQCVYSQDDN